MATLLAHGERERSLEVGVVWTVRERGSGEGFESVKATGAEESSENRVDGLSRLLESRRNGVGQASERVDAVELAFGQPIAQAPAHEQGDVSVEEVGAVVE